VNDIPRTIPPHRPARRHRRTAILGLVLAVGCSRPGLPNVVLVTFDTTRADRFGCTGDPEARTPTVDALAARGLLFTKAFASVALTLPSHTTIMTGLEPIVHGVHDNGRFRVPDDLDTLAERLHAAGFETAAFVSAFVLDGRFRLGQGFDASHAMASGRTSWPPPTTWSA
jgi:arylsulfatase A-like enzyme